MTAFDTLLEQADRKFNPDKGGETFDQLLDQASSKFGLQEPVLEEIEPTDETVDPEQQALEQTRADELFQSAREAEIGSDVITGAPLTRFNQIRRELRVPKVFPRHVEGEPEGSLSTELSTGVSDPRLNGGRETVIPRIWGDEVLSPKQATERAIQSGLVFRSFDSIEEAEKFAAERHKVVEGNPNHEFLGKLPDVETLPDELLDGRAVNAAKSVVAGFADTANRAIEGVGDIADALSEFVGIDFQPPSDFFEASRNAIKAFLPDDPRLREEFFSSQLPRGLGSTLGFAAFGASGGAAGLIGAGAAVGAQEQAEAGRESAASMKTQAVATILGGVLGLTESALPIRKAKELGLTKFLKPLDRLLDGKFFNAILTKGGITVDVAIEAGQEAGQQIGSNVIAKQILGQDKEVLDGVLESAEVGGGVGAIFNILAKLAGIKLPKFKSPEAQKGADVANEQIEKFRADVPEVPRGTAIKPVEPTKEVPDAEAQAKAQAETEAVLVERTKQLRRGGLSKEAARSRAEAELAPVEEAPPATTQEPIDKVIKNEVDTGRVANESLEKAQQETGNEGLGAVPPIVAEILARDEPDFDYYPNDQIKKGLSGLRELPVKTISETAKGWAQEIWGLTRPQKHLKADAFNSSANKYFELRRSHANRVSDEMVRHVSTVVGGLKTSDLRVMEDFLFARNQLKALEMGQPLRWPFESREQVQEMLDNIEKTMEERPGVRAAIDSRSEINRELVQQLVDQDILPETTLENVEDYMHQQVIMYSEAGRVASGKEPPFKKRGFQKKRVTGPEILDKEYAYLWSFLHSESRWLTDANSLLDAKRKFEAFVVKPYDIHDTLLEKAKAEREGGNEAAHWSDFIPEGYTDWYPQPGNIMYRAFSIPERIGEALTADVYKSLNLSAEDLKTVLAMGGKHKPIVVPENIAKQLDVDEKPSDNIFARATRKFTSTWKLWTTQNPKRAIAYNLRNVTGDGDAVLAGGIGVHRNAKKTTDELWKYYRGDILMSPELKAAHDIGVISSSFEAVEVPDITTFKSLQRFASQKNPFKSLPADIISGYFNKIGQFTQFRESWLYYASWLRFREILTKGGPDALKTFGASKEEVVRELFKRHGVDIAAQQLATDLVGNYNNVSVLGRWLSTYMLPFYRWQELNMRRIPRLSINAVRAKSVATGAAVPINVVRAILLSRLAWLYAGIQAWNNLMFPEKEDDLAQYDRENVHVVVCRNDDGTVRIFRNVGMMGDWLEWAGINTLISLLPQIESESLTWGELATESAKSIPNKAIQMVNPALKSTYEVLTGTTLFPDVFNPRIKDRGEAIADVGGLTEEYRAIRGKLEQNGMRARPNYTQRILVGVVDPKRNALSEMYGLRGRYEARLGRQSPIVPRSQFATIRQSLMNNDFEAYKEALGDFVDQKKQQGVVPFRSYKQSLKNLDPIASKLNSSAERDFEQNFLNGDQRKRLRVARDYASDLRALGLKWWRDAFKEVVNPRLRR